MPADRCVPTTRRDGRASQALVGARDSSLSLSSAGQELGQKNAHYCRIRAITLLLARLLRLSSHEYAWRRRFYQKNLTEKKRKPLPSFRVARDGKLPGATGIPNSHSRSSDEGGSFFR